MTRTEAKEASSYAIGDVVRFTKDYAVKGVSRGVAYTVAGIDTEKAAVILTARDGRRIDWRLRQWGATQSQVFTAEPIELRAGDRVQFTRNDRAAGRVNGQQGEVIGVDPAARTVTLRMATRRIALRRGAPPIAFWFMPTARPASLWIRRASMSPCRGPGRALPSIPTTAPSSPQLFRSGLA